MKVEFQKSKTLRNLARSFASECMEGAKYQFMAKKCTSENLNFLNATLKTLAKHEMSHAKIFWDCIVENCDGVVDNVEINMGYPFQTETLVEDFLFSSENERELSDNIYPAFSLIAKDEGFLEIAKKFDMVAEVEETHSLLLSEVHKKLKGNKLYKSPQAICWKCSQCGFSVKGKTAFKTCPLCNYGQGYAEVQFNQESN